MESAEDLLGRLAAVARELEEARAGRDALERERDELKQHLARLAAQVQEYEQALVFPPGHFYSPLVDTRDPKLSTALSGEPVGELPFDPSTTLAWLERIVAHYRSLDFPEQRSPGRRFWLENDGFSYSDAITLSGMVRELRPKRYIEAGCGYSSCALMDLNDRHFAGAIETSFIDPYPELLLSLLSEDDPYRARVRKAALQDVPLAEFMALGANDVLFLDTSHVGKTGSDVLDYVFRILPALSSGVVVHVHDIFYPFEYLPEWITEHRRSWNEIYLVRAFLEGNRDWEILFFNDWVYRCNAHLVAERMPLCLRNRGGSLWLRRK